ncbi:unnamed protein product [Linum tenue]|uniref:Uncharacterized protein n=1 Tax=Linum tenue TaxID=586396 RepID=A0AAV0PLA6_9ROSI|nr:unnamed protein product [Linum tenue]
MRSSVGVEASERCLHLVVREKLSPTRDVRNGKSHDEPRARFFSVRVVSPSSPTAVPEPINSMSSKWIEGERRLQRIYLFTMKWDLSQLSAVGAACSYFVSATITLSHQLEAVISFRTTMSVPSSTKSIILTSMALSLSAYSTLLSREAAPGLWLSS